MTLASDLVTRVRSNINEPATLQDQYRTDAEIIQWLDDAQMDYLHRVPQEYFPELTESVTFSGSSVALPSDYLFFHGASVSHTLSGTYAGVDQCFLLSPGEQYLVTNWPTMLGAWARITGSAMDFGPNVYSGTLTYVKKPTQISTSSVTIGIQQEHEAALVAYASYYALLKTNDADSQAFLNNYVSFVQAKGGRVESKEIERA